MARPLRIEYPGAVYHITSRGNARQDIFLDDEDRRVFLELLSQTVERFNWLCHAYCLMDNHYHLLVETLAPTLSRGMRQLNGVYTQKFNRRHGRVGHLFQGRYKAILVEKESHLLELCRYVVLNPVRAGLVRWAGDWPWSSYRATAGLEEAPPFLNTDWVLAQFAGEGEKARRAYQEFVAQGLGKSPWDALRGQVFLGSEEFLKSLPLPKGERLKEVPQAQRLANRPALGEIFQNRAVDEAIALAYREYGYTLQEIAAHLGVHYSTVSRRLRRFEQRTREPDA